MTITNGYCTLAEIKDDDVLNYESSSAHDTILETVIEAVSRAIDNYTGRRFYSASETRYYTAEQGDILFIDDLSTASGLALLTDEDGDRTYETTWATTDYDLMPHNASTNGHPFNMIETTPNGVNTFPGTKKGVKITGTFGWAAVPKPVNRACVLWSERVFKRYTTPLGQAGATTVGTIVLKIPGPDPDVCMLLNPYRVILP